MKKEILISFIVLLALIGCISNKDTQKRPEKIILGRTYIIVPDNAIVGVQVDRVIRDITWDIWDERKVDASYIPKNMNEIIPYMEGERTRDLMRYANISVIPLTPCVCKRGLSGRCYARDGGGITGLR